MMKSKDFFKHYGIKGQKWHVRRKRGPDGTVSGGTGKVDTSEARSGRLTRGSKNRSKLPLTDAQLRARVNRLQMEKQYDQLMAEKHTVGKSFIKEMLKESGKKTARTITERAMLAAAEAALSTAAGKTKNAKAADLLNTIAKTKKNNKKDK